MTLFVSVKYVLVLPPFPGWKFVRKDVSFHVLSGPDQRQLCPNVDEQTESEKRCPNRNYKILKFSIKHVAEMVPTLSNLEYFDVDKPALTLNLI